MFVDKGLCPRVRGTWFGQRAFEHLHGPGRDATFYGLAGIQ